MGLRSKRILALSVFALMGVVGVSAQDSDVPRYKVDPFWPKELPNNWIMGQVGGMAIDSQDHIWVLQRPRSSTPDEVGASQTPPRSVCCVKTPAVLEFDTSGNLIRSWGGPGFVPEWPTSEHAIWADKSNNVWISGSSAGDGSGNADREVIKFSADGKQLLEIGRHSDAPRNNQDTSMLDRAASLQVDDAAHEIYIADGYGNNRVVVYDTDTGAFKRGWGAYGIPLDQVSNENPPRYVPTDPPSKQFNTVHCARISVDGLVYVCDRLHDRVQIFTKQGVFQKEFFLRPATRGNGSTFTVDFSHDRQQKYLLVADGENNVISILRRSDGVEVGQFGHNGRNAGQFHEVHQVAMDSKGNIYTGEVDTGKRVQKFLLQN